MKETEEQAKERIQSLIDSGALHVFETPPPNPKRVLEIFYEMRDRSHGDERHFWDRVIYRMENPDRGFFQRIWDWIRGY